MTSDKFSLSDWVDEAIADCDGRVVIKDWLINEGFETIFALSKLNPEAMIPTKINEVKIKKGWLLALSACIQLLANKLTKSSSGFFTCLFVELLLFTIKNN